MLICKRRTKTAIVWRAFMLQVKSRDYWKVRHLSPVLVHSHSKRSYCTDAKSDFRNSGPSFIVDHFDTYYSVIEANDCPISTSTRAFDSLYEAIDKLARELSVELKKSPLGDDVRMDLSNITKMLVFLLVNTVKVIDSYMNNSDVGKGNKKVCEYCSIVINYRCLCSVLFFRSKRWIMNRKIGHENAKMP